MATFYDCANPHISGSNNFGAIYGSWNQHIVNISPAPIVSPLPTGGCTISSCPDLRLISLLAEPLHTLLVPVTDAAHDRDRKKCPPDSCCAAGTRARLIKLITSKVDNPLSPRRIIWLHGYVGCGKSAIVQTLCDHYAREKRLAGSFVFFRQSGDRSKIEKLATTLAYQLAEAIPITEQRIREAVTKRPTIVNSTTSLEVQFQQLIFHPLLSAFPPATDLNRSGDFSPYLIVIDGLDGCIDHDGIALFLDLILNFFRAHPHIPIRLLIASRIEEHIRTHLQGEEVQTHDVGKFDADEDIRRFLKLELDQLAGHDRVLQAYMRSKSMQEWPSAAELNDLVSRSNKSFLLASMILSNIRGLAGKRNGATPMERLKQALALGQSLHSVYADTFRCSEKIPHSSDILTTIALSPRPLTIAAIARILGLQSFQVVQVLVDLQAVIHLPEGEYRGLVTVLHSSVLEFLNSELLAPSSSVVSASEAYHRRVFARAFNREVKSCTSPPSQDPPSPLQRALASFHSHHLEEWWKEIRQKKEIDNISTTIQLGYEILQKWYPQWFQKIQPVWELLMRHMLESEEPYRHSPVVEKLLSMLLGNKVPLAHTLAFHRILDSGISHSGIYLHNPKLFEEPDIRQFVSRRRSPPQQSRQEESILVIATKLPLCLFHEDLAIRQYAVTYWPWFLSKARIWEARHEKRRSKPFPVPPDPVAPVSISLPRLEMGKVMQRNLELCYTVTVSAYTLRPSHLALTVSNYQGSGLRLDIPKDEVLPYTLLGMLEVRSTIRTSPRSLRLIIIQGLRLIVNELKTQSSRKRAKATARFQSGPADAVLKLEVILE